MNAILLGAASLGSLIAIFTAQPEAKPTAEPAQLTEDVGAMTHDTLVDEAGAGGGGRTHKSVRTVDFESTASANSATPAA